MYSDLMTYKPVRLQRITPSCHGSAIVYRWVNKYFKPVSQVTVQCAAQLTGQRQMHAVSVMPVGLWFPSLTRMRA